MYAIKWDVACQFNWVAICQFQEKSSKHLKYQILCCIMYTWLAGFVIDSKSILCMELCYFTDNFILTLFVNYTLSFWEWVYKSASF